MHRLVLLGLNHSTAPLAVREKLAFNALQQREALQAFREKFADCEAVLLSTCNRVELYAATAVANSPTADEMLAFLAGLRGMDPARFHEHLYRKSDRGVVQHLFTVASSLDSMVLGESQILGQVREAYDLAREHDSARTLLNPLFQRAIAVGKQVMTETTIGGGRLSVASVAVDYARRIFDHFNDKTILNIGAGKMATLVLRNFADLQVGKLLLCNRDAAKAAKLAEDFGGEIAPFEKLDEHLIAADIVVTSTGASEPIITRARFEKLLRPRRYKPIFIIDIALPRDVEPTIEKLENVYLYNLDHLQQVVSTTQSQRKESVDAARGIVTHHVHEFLSWHRQRQMGPLIDGLYRRYHGLANDELARTLNKLPNIGEAEKSHLEELTRRIVNKLLHDPIRMLRHSDPQHGPPTQYIHAMEKLFGLETPSAPPAETPATPPADGTDEQSE
jgi:glutamyl-tRNA reductase